MCKQRIQQLQCELNNMIDNNDDYSEIYKTSIELDTLIVEYYNDVLNRKGRDCQNILNES
ncbi:MAG: hypothetical protein BWY74_02225 [Firmicutes bacterium ADurb.Bin419]|nr:MAG: hypothetical protein BWY74_02225 [Firmicutes bacterium ADurb.Bin419]